jgi:tetratricopeptide (TPR) repeat protein
METIKCKSCGAVQEVNNEATICDFCGSAIELQQSKDFYREIVKSEFGNFLMMAETAEEATNYEEATKYYNKILEKDTSYSDAWLGKGNCMIYSSTIGDIRMKEALTYWKNAIKFSENQEPMKLRVGKEINNVINTFFPNLLNHYNEFSGLDDSYLELASRFLTLEEAIDYATQLCPNELEFFQTGFNLCELVIKAPGASAKTEQYAAVGKIAGNLLTGNKYAAQGNQDDYSRAIERKNQINKFGNIIKVVEDKYFNGLVRLGFKNADDTRTAVYTRTAVSNENFSEKGVDSSIILMVGAIIIFSLFILGHSFFAIIAIIIVVILYSKKK